MSVIQFEDGTKIQFDGEPTQQDIEDVVGQLGIGNQQAPQRQPGFLENAGGAIGQAAINFLFPKTLQQSLQGVGQSTLQRGFLGAGQQYRQEQEQGLRPTDLQTAGAAANSALTFGSFALPVAPTALGRIGQAAKLGAGFGATQAISEGGGLNEAAKGAALGGVAGGVTGGAIEGASKLFDYISQTLPQRIVNAVIPQSKAELGKGKDLAEYVLNRKIPVNLESSENRIKILSQHIDEILDEASTPKIKNFALVNKNDLLNSVAKSYGQTGGGGTIAGDEIEKILNRVTPQAKGLLSRDSLSLSDANKLRKIIDKTLGARFFLQSTEPPFTKDVLGTFNNFLRNTVKDSVPQTKPLFDELSKEITLRNALKNVALNAQRRSAITLKDLISLATGGVIGSPFGGLGGLVGGAGSVALERAAQNPAIGVGAARALRAGSQPLKFIGQKTLPVARTAILRGATSIRGAK